MMMMSWYCHQKRDKEGREEGSVSEPKKLSVLDSIYMT